MGNTNEEQKNEAIAKERAALRKAMIDSKENFGDDFDIVSRGLVNLTYMEGCSPIISRFTVGFNTDIRTKNDKCNKQYDSIIAELND